ncbi:DUF4834 family protein [Carboxylicivirga sp. M1479]|uniref:DUF4834 family protein n=1 Tax=Carboxylicivirga sp. M1479 TaxID=2594476 RepID=UPI001177AAA5|nr:DUF4834 family protein [Carboxylicivirga sp. M1479]TRX72484.1 DUF4834 family protein [Carboxylicivirga sp. M1479]
MLVGLVNTIAFLVVSYYLFKFIGRLLLPILMKKGVERMQQQQQNAANQYRQQAQQQEGNVTIKKEKAKKTSQVVDDNEGEYVDFEEVK